MCSIVSCTDGKCSKFSGPGTKSVRNGTPDILRDAGVKRNVAAPPNRPAPRAPTQNQLHGLSRRLSSSSDQNAPTLPKAPSQKRNAAPTAERTPSRAYLETPDPGKAG